MLKVQLKPRAHSRPALGLRQREGSPKRVSGLSHDSMCGCLRSPLCWDVSGAVLVWSLVCFFFNLARRCYCCLLSWSACLLISSFFWDFFFFLDILFFFFFAILSFSTQALTFCPSDFLLPSHTHQHTQPHTSTSPHAPWIPFFAVSCVRLWLLTVLLVFLQSRKASEQAKSVDSKTDSIGSGRAIPIKQVSSFLFLPHISLRSLVSIFIFFLFK